MSRLNPMRTTCRLVKMSIQAYVEPIRECVRKKSRMQVFDALFSKICYDGFNNLQFHDIKQSESMLEGQ